MALLRLSAMPGAALTAATLATLTTLGACGQAGAQPAETGSAATTAGSNATTTALTTAGSSGLTPPATWQALPALADAVELAMKGVGIGLERTEAWGEPARGCYAVWLSLRGVGASAPQVLAGLTAEGFTTQDVVAPAGTDGLVTLGFEKPPYRGQLRARVTAGTIVALACFANPREPAACEAGCTALLGGLP